MAAYYPEIQDQALPSDFLLERLNIPAFRMIFQSMIFAALLESGTGGVHAINERIAQAYQSKRGRVLAKSARLGITMIVLIGSVFVANQFGLVSLIASGYRWLAYAFLAIYVLPLVTIGAWRLLRRSAVVRQGAIAALLFAALMVLVPTPVPAQAADPAINVRKQVVSDEHSPRAFRFIGPTRNIGCAAPHAPWFCKPLDRTTDARSPFNPLGDAGVPSHQLRHSLLTPRRAPYSR
jgi:hypothetical protein